MGVRNIDLSKCSRCGLCSLYCPQDVLRPNEKKEPCISYLVDCQSCFLCEKYCPKGAITVTADRERRPILPWHCG